MNSTLIRTEGEFPPAGYEFLDPITGKRYKDMHTTFKERVKEIVRDRTANLRLVKDQKRVDPFQVAIELSEYTCSRLNHNPRYCTHSLLNQPPGELHLKVKSVQQRICPNCGAPNMKEILCPTCSGRKVTGLECTACHTKIKI